MFLVPRGNMYFLENVCDREVKLFFTQARKVMVDRQIVDGEEVEVEVEEDEDGQVVDEVRSSSGPANNRKSAPPVKTEKTKGSKGSK
jgi:centromere protein C